MNLLQRLASLATELDNSGFTKEANQIDTMISKLAEQKGAAFYQHDPKTGMFRGIIEFVDEAGTVKLIPEKPLLDKTLTSLKTKLQKLVPTVILQHNGVGEPWFPEVNMPFDAKGNRVM